MISWFIGALALNALIAALIGSELSRLSWQVVLLLALGLIPSTLLGYFLGMLTCWPLIRPLCSKYNGAPFRIGDQVMILSGLHKGTVAAIYEISPGQGGWNLVRLKLGAEYEEKFTDIFEEYSVLRTNISGPAK